MRRFGVEQLTREIARLIEGRYPQLEVVGEVSHLNVAASGHAYFSLKEGKSSLGAVCWRDTWRSLDFRPKLGDEVVCRGRMGVYGARGAYQLYVHHVARAGEGALAAEIAKRRARLEADGLLDPRRKRDLPRFPRVVGVATSLAGAALQDFLQVSRQRHPAARILVAGCQVQGEQAPGSVVQAVDLLLEDGRAEVIVVTRGGGSKQDLLAFQDEALARFLAASPVPVVSAVGHQIDTTLADLVADAVAATPTEAAVLVLPDGPALMQRVDDTQLGLAAAFGRQLARRRERVRALRSRLRDPAAGLRAARRRAEDLQGRAVARMTADLASRRRAVAEAEDRLRGAGPRGLPARRDAVARASRELRVAMSRLIAAQQDRVRALEGTARALSPQGVLERGYAVVTGPSGVVDRADAVAPDDRVGVRVRDGSFTAVVVGEDGD